MTQELAVQDDKFLAPLSSMTAEMQQEMAEALGPEGPTFGDLIRITVPSGGGTFFEVPSIGGDSETVKEIQGVVIDLRDVRRYYAKGGDEITPGEPPDCASEDGIVGIGDPGGECASCPLNRWGSRTDGKRGKACSQRRLMFLLSPEIHILPIVVDAPPSSLKGLKSYFMRLPAQGLSRGQVVSGFKLSKAKSRGGVEYSEIVPRLVARLTDEQVEQVAVYRESFGPALSQGAFADPPAEG